MTTSGYVLIHGGCHDARCWAEVVTRTRRPAVAIDLPGRGDRPARLSEVRSADFVAAIVADTEATGWDEVILVGHSLAGLTAPAAAARLDGRVRHLVFISATIPDAGRSTVDMVAPPLRKYLRRRFSRAATRQDGMMDVPRPLARLLFGSGLSEAERSAMLDGLVKDAPRLMIEPVPPIVLPDGVGVTYLGPVRDRTFPPYLQRRMAANIGAEHVPIPGGHEVMYSHPERVAVELDRIGDAAFSPPDLG